MQADLKKQEAIKASLSYNIGTEHYYSFDLAKNTYTDGIADMATQCKADWLVTSALVMCEHLSKKYDFLVVRFKYITDIPNYVAVVTYEDGNDNVLNKSLIDVTDFPLDEFMMFYENDVLCLPSER